MSTLPDLRSITHPNLFCMHPLYEAFRDNKKVSPLARHLNLVDRGDEA